MSKNYYEILGVPRNATEQELKTAYYRLARKSHPDKAMSSDQQQALEAQFSLISAAYNVLKDKEKRGAYDKTIEAHTSGGQQAQGPSAQPAPSATTAGTGQSTEPRTNRSGGYDQNRASVAKRAFAKGLQLFQGGDFSKAAEFFEVAVKNNDAEAVYHARLAMALLRGQRSFSRAIESAERAVEIDPYNSEFRLILAEIYESANSPSMAIKVYDEILKWDPENSRAKMALDTLRSSKSRNIITRLFGKKK